MTDIRQLKSAALLDLQGTGYSRRWLWELIQRLELDVGSRVLVAGNRCLGLLRFFARLGVEATGLDDSRDDLPGPLPRASDLEIVSARPDISVPFDAPSFDAVIVGGLRSWRSSLTTAPALLTTANLLAALRPGGRFVVLSGGELLIESNGEHRHSCFANMLTAFGEQVETVAGRNLFRWAMSLWRSSTSVPQDYQVILSLPAEQRSRNDWVQIATESAARSDEVCCDSAVLEPERSVA